MKNYWPKLTNDVKNLVNNCTISQWVIYERHPPLNELQLTLSSKKPFETVHVDKVKFVNVIPLTICDCFSKCGKAYVMPSLLAVDIYHSL